MRSAPLPHVSGIMRGMDKPRILRGLAYVGLWLLATVLLLGGAVRMEAWLRPPPPPPEKPTGKPRSIAEGIAKYRELRRAQIRTGCTAVRGPTTDGGFDYAAVAVTEQYLDDGGPIWTVCNDHDAGGMEGGP